MAFSGCLVKKASDPGSANRTVAAAQTFDTDVYDIGGWHDAAGNSSKLIIPAGVTRARFAANIDIGSITGDDTHLMEIRKNGASFDTGKYSFTSADISPTRQQVWTNIVSVVAGDEIEFWYNNTTDTATTLFAGDTWFFGEAIPLEGETFSSGALLKNASDATSQNYFTGGPIAISWDTVVYDYGTWYAGGTPSRLTAPTGTNYVRLRAQIGLASLASNDAPRLGFTKNDSTLIEAVSNTNINFSMTTITTPRAQMMSPVIPCVATDFFKLTLLTEADTSITLVAAESWFSAEKVA